MRRVHPYDVLHKICSKEYVNEIFEFEELAFFQFNSQRYAALAKDQIHGGCVYGYSTQISSLNSNALR